MNFILNLAAVIITFCFFGLFTFSMVINIIRASKVTREIKTDPDYVVANVIDVVKDKKRVFVTVEYVSKSNMGKFKDVFELTHKEFNDQYYVGQEVKVFYAKATNQKRITCFPIYLEGQKLSLEAGPIVTDALMVVGAGYIFASCLFTVLNVVNGYRGLSWNFVRPFVEGTRSFDTITATADATLNLPCFNILYIFVIIFVYFMLVSLVLERITGMSGSHLSQYLKLRGIKVSAEVKTFKFGRSKDSSGNKEAQLKISFRTNVGEEVQCDLNSYLYSRTQEQFITVLYDPINPKNVVYMQGSKK